AVRRSCLPDRLRDHLVCEPRQLGRPILALPCANIPGAAAGGGPAPPGYAVVRGNGPSCCRRRVRRCGLGTAAGMPVRSGVHGAPTAGAADLPFWEQSILPAICLVALPAGSAGAVVRVAAAAVPGRVSRPLPGDSRAESALDGRGGWGAFAKGPAGLLRPDRLRARPLADRHLGVDRFAWRLGPASGTLP